MIDLADLEAKARAATKDWVHRTSADDAGFIAAAQPSVVLELIERIRAAESAKAGEPVAWRYETDAEHIARDMKEGRFPERSPKQQVPPFHAAPVDTAALAERVKTLENALEWYAEQARLCRLIHSEGDAGRHALSADGGKRARKALGGSND